MQTEAADKLAFLGGAGEMGKLIAAFDWARTCLGPLADWSAPMKTVLSLILRSPAPIVTLWGDNGVMIYNDAYRLFAGTRHPSLLGSDVLEGWAEVADFNRNVMQKVYRDGETLSYKDQELTLLRDGVPRVLWTDLEYSPAIGDDGRPIGVMAIVVETTEKVLASRRVQDDRNRLWAISQDLLLVCTFEGVITAVNPSVTRMLGWSQQEMIGRNVSTLLHPDDYDITVAELEKLSRGVTTLAFENRYRAKDGQYRLLSWTAVPGAGRIHAVGRDITSERQAARDRERIWTLSPVLKVVTDTAGRITDVNPSWTKLLGWTRDETVGKLALNFLVDTDESWRDRVAILQAGAALPDYRSTFLTKTGEQRLIQWTTVREDGVFYGFGRDVTAEAESAAALAETEAALRQSQKMEAVGQLTGGIAHDFNNLLQGVTGSLEIVQRHIGQGRFDEVERFVAGASAAAARAAALTHRLLAFSRRQPIAPKPLLGNSLIASMEDLLRRTIGERIELTMALADDLWVTKCDANQLESAILNLVINARDAMPDGGRLIIGTNNAELDDLQAARRLGIKPGHYVCVSVSDTGVGMDALTASKAFEPFFTTKPIGQGTGLGLSMIYGFAQQSEGYTRIESEIGCGATVTLYLPRFTGVAEADEIVVGQTASSSADHGEIVLVIEDEAIVRGLIVEELKELGYRPLEAADGPSGLDMLRSSQRIDLLVTDIGLPGLNGRQVVDAARLVRPQLKVLFMTGYAENAALAAGFLERGMRLITKPFSMEALAVRIREMLEERDGEAHI